MATEKERKKKRKPSSKRSDLGREKIAEVMHEFKEGELHSGRSGKIVTDRDQAIAIALSEAREAGADIPPPPKKKKKAPKGKAKS